MRGWRSGVGAPVGGGRRGGGVGVAWGMGCEGGGVVAWEGWGWGVKVEVWCGGRDRDGV